LRLTARHLDVCMSENQPNINVTDKSWSCPCVVVKSQTNLIVKKLTALQPVHKVLLTGTPLNNTVRELLNLMYFLDPGEWSNLDKLEKHYAEMTEDLAKELREKIAPYMLRRRKEDVLDLPPKVSTRF
jgi:chromodomain-helicase-DNA-binding protein 4